LVFNIFLTWLHAKSFTEHQQDLIVEGHRSGETKNSKALVNTVINKWRTYDIIYYQSGQNWWEDNEKSGQEPDSIKIALVAPCDISSIHLGYGARWAKDISRFWLSGMDLIFTSDEVLIWWWCLSTVMTHMTGVQSCS